MYTLTHTHEHKGRKKHARKHEKAEGGQRASKQADKDIYKR